MRIRSRLLARLAAFLLLAAILPAPAGADETAKPGEYEVKAAYLLNFGKFVQWPSGITPVENGHTFFICVLGRDPFGPILDSTLAGETISGKNVIGKHVSSPEEAQDCQVLFVSSSEDNHRPDILRALAKAPILTVSDLPDFTRNGGMIQFVTEGNRIRFEVNLSAAQKTGLSLSSQLLKVAVHVRTESHPGD